MASSIPGSSTGGIALLFLVTSAARLAPKLVDGSVKSSKGSGCGPLGLTGCGEVHLVELSTGDYVSTIPLDPRFPEPVRITRMIWSGENYYEL